MVRGDDLQKDDGAAVLVVVPAPGTPDVLLERLALIAERAGLVLGHADTSAPPPDDAGHMALLFRPAVTAIATRMASGIAPSAALERWIEETGAILLTAGDLGSSASLVDVENPGPGLARLARALGAEPADMDGAPVPAREMADPVLLALAEAVFAGSEPARRLTALLAVVAPAGGDAPVPAPVDADAGFSRYVDLLSQRPEGASAASPAPSASVGDVDRLTAMIAELGAERDALLEQLAETQDALVNAYTEHRVLRRQVIALDKDFANPAFYGLEHVTPDRPFRWMGREAEAVITTLVPCERPVRVTVQIELAVSDTALDGLQIGADGVYSEETWTERMPNGSFHKTAIIAPRETESRYTRLTLSLRAPDRKDMSEFGDKRTLAVGVSRIIVAEVGEPIEPLVEAPMEGPFRQSIVFDERVNSPAFYGVERRPGDNLVFRWMGRAETAELPVRLPPGRRVRVSAHSPIVIDDAALSGFTFGINGAFAADYEIERTVAGMVVKRAFFTVPGSPEGPLTQGRIDLRAGSRTDLSAQGDARLLAIGLHSLEIEELDEADEADDAAAEPAGDDAADGIVRVLTAQQHFDYPAFYHLERRDFDQMPFRWMGREDEQAFIVRVPRDRPLHVTVHLAHAIDQAALDGFEIGIEDAFAQDYELALPPEGGAVKSATFTLLNPTADSAPVRLQLRLKSKVDLSDRGDPRTLGVALSKIVVRQV